MSAAGNPAGHYPVSNNAPPQPPEICPIHTGNTTMIAALITMAVLVLFGIFAWWATGCDPFDKPWLNERLARFRAGEPPDPERDDLGTAEVVGPIPPPGCP